MKLSIILPVYNMEKYLDRSLKSLLQQDLPEEDYEIIIYNDVIKIICILNFSFCF